MKKSIQKIIVLCLLPVLAFAFLLAGCGNGDNNENTQKYTVTVINGTGGGEFESGASCTVTATVPSGLRALIGPPAANSAAPPAIVLKTATAPVRREAPGSSPNCANSTAILSK